MPADWVRLVAFAAAAGLWFLIETSFWAFMVFGRNPSDAGERTDLVLDPLEQSVRLLRSVIIELR